MKQLLVIVLLVGLLVADLHGMRTSMNIKESDVGSSKIKDSTVVTIQTGQVQGFVEDNARLFLGIPYAESTAGQNRWAPPVPKASWTGTYQATSFTPSCPQICYLPSYLCPTNYTEDCLKVNVYAPIPTSSNPGPWPVMVFIYGGAFFQGTSMVEVYSGKFMAGSSNVVVVTGEYRLGVLGFLVTDELAGNYGILDQRLYMQWTQDNIAAFGGDDTKVTLFGESAGAMSTAIHWTSQESWGLFDQIILESDPFSIEMPSIAQAKKAGVNFADKIGCGVDDLSCLRGASLESVVKGGDAVIVIPDLLNFTLEAALVWQPNLDGQIIKNQILKSVASSSFKKVPMMLGTNQDEGIMFMYQIADYVDDVEYAAAIAAIFSPEDAPEILEQYPVSIDPIKNIIDNMSNLLTDYLFACSGRSIGDAISNEVPFYLYHFDHVLSFYQSWGNNFKFCWDKCCHGSELPFVFHSASDSGFNYTAEELILTNEMVLYWTNFATNGNPNTGSNVNVQWPQYSNTTRLNIRLATPINQEQYYVNEHCDFWDKLGYSF